MNLPLPFEVKTVFKDALPVLDKFAPTLGAVIGGYPGLAMNIVIPLLAKAFGKNPSNLADIAESIIKDQAAALKLQGLEEEHCHWLCSIMKSVNKLQSLELSVKLHWQPS